MKNAFRRIARPSIKDADGLCVDALRLVFESHKALFAAAISAAIASTATMSQFKVYGKVYGKV